MMHGNRMIVRIHGVDVLGITLHQVRRQLQRKIVFLAEIPLQGDKEQRLHTIQFKNLAAGEYTLRAQVLSNSSVRSQTEQGIMVTGDGTTTGGW